VSGFATACAAQIMIVMLEPIVARIAVEQKCAHNFFFFYKESVFLWSLYSPKDDQFFNYFLVFISANNILHCAPRRIYNINTVILKKNPNNVFNLLTCPAPQSHPTAGISVLVTSACIAMILIDAWIRYYCSEKITTIK
jgi:hypothetical protein